MSTTIDQAFVTQFEKDVHIAYQQKHSKLRNTVRTKNNVKGSTTRFFKSGKGVAVQKTRHGIVQPMNIDHSYVNATMEDWYAPEYIDKLDELKFEIDERQVIVDNAAGALARQTDTNLIEQLEQTSETVGDYSAPLNLSLLSQAIQKLNQNEVPDDGQRFGLLSANAWEHFINLPEVSDTDYVGEMYPWLKGTEAKKWRNIVWQMHTDLPLASTDNRDCYLYHKTAVGHAIASDIQTEMNYVPERVAHLSNSMLSHGAILIDTLGVVEIRVDDDTAIS